MQRALYFGCLEDIGHYFWTIEGRSSMYGRETERWLPGAWDKLADSGLLMNGKVPDKPTGDVYWTCATEDRFAFFWWDRSVDTRSGSNSGFYTTGIADRNAAFDFACKAFPTVVARQKHPLIIKDR